MPAPTDPPRPFSLSRTFAIGSLVTILALTACAAAAMSYFVSQRMLLRDTELSGEFINSLIVTPAVVATLRGEPIERKVFVEQIRELGAMPDVIRANVYDPRGKVTWSSDKRLVGQTFPGNHELAEAMAGKVVMHRGRPDSEDLEKPEHRYLAKVAGGFVESYVPIRAPGGEIVGAVELYRVPHALFETLRQGTWLIWGAAGVIAAVLFGVLFGIVRRGDRLLRWQNERLLESGRLAAVGEMAASVAHGIRNPLASIRSSAELALDADPGDLARSAHDIIASVDRAERWVSDLLRCAVPPEGAQAGQSTDPGLAATTAFDQFREEFRQRGLVARLQIEPGLPRVAGAPDVISQAVSSLLANACEASPQGAPLMITVRRQGSGVAIAVDDCGCGIPKDDLARVFEPYFTSKARGLGLGLPLVRATVERLGGRIGIDSKPGRGTLVHIELPVAGAAPAASAPLAA